MMAVKTTSQSWITLQHFLPYAAVMIEPAPIPRQSCSSCPFFGSSCRLGCLVFQNNICVILLYSDIKKSPFPESRKGDFGRLFAALKG